MKKNYTFFWLLPVWAYLLICTLKNVPVIPLFSNMPDFEAAECGNREFDKLEFTLTDKAKNSYKVLEKTGEFTERSA